MTTAQAIITIAIVAAITFFTRILPFALFPAGRETPRYVVYLGKVLPYAMMGMLVIYCLKGVQPAVFPYGVPEIAAILLVCALFLWKRNTLLAIAGGTALYMFLVQAVFV